MNRCEEHNHADMPRFKIVKGETSVAFYLKLNSKVAPTDDAPAVLKVAIGALFKGRPGFSRVLAG